LPTVAVTANRPGQTVDHRLLSPASGGFGKRQSPRWDAAVFPAVFPRMFPRVFLRQRLSGPAFSDTKVSGTVVPAAEGTRHRMRLKTERSRLEEVQHDRLHFEALHSRPAYGRPRAERPVARDAMTWLRYRRSETTAPNTAPEALSSAVTREWPPAPAPPFAHACPVGATSAQHCRTGHRPTMARFSHPARRIESIRGAGAPGSEKTM